MQLIDKQTIRSRPKNRLEEQFGGSIVNKVKLTILFITLICLTGCSKSQDEHKNESSSENTSESKLISSEVKHTSKPSRNSEAETEAEEQTEKVESHAGKSEVTNTTTVYNKLSDNLIVSREWLINRPYGNSSDKYELKGLYEITNTSDEAKCYEFGADFIDVNGEKLWDSYENYSNIIEPGRTGYVFINFISQHLADKIDAFDHIELNITETDINEYKDVTVYDCYNIETRKGPEEQYSNYTDFYIDFTNYGENTLDTLDIYFVTYKHGTDDIQDIVLMGFNNE